MNQETVKPFFEKEIAVGVKNKYDQSRLFYHFGRMIDFNEYGITIIKNDSVRQLFYTEICEIHVNEG